MMCIYFEVLQRSTLLSILFFSHKFTIDDILIVS